MKKVKSFFQLSPQLIGRILSIVVCLVLCQISVAQGRREYKLKHEISMGCGFGMLMQIKWSDLNDKWRSPSMHFQFLYNVNRHLGIGAMLDYAYSSWNIEDAAWYKYTNNDYKEKESTKWFSFGPTARVYWFNHDYFAI